MLNVVDDIVDDEEDEATCDICSETENFCYCINCAGCGDKVAQYDACPVCENACTDRGCCSCCSSCGYQECECCEYCGYSDCECGESFGSSTEAPWERRGIKVSGTAHNSTTNWQSIWPEIDAKNFDLCQEAADFYLLEAITSGVVNCDVPMWTQNNPTVATKEMLYTLIGVDDERTIKHLEQFHKEAAEEAQATPLEATLRGILKDAKKLFDERIDRADNILRAYFHMAVAGEARHHRALKNRMLSVNREMAWSGWRSIYDEVGPEALIDLADLFMEFEDGAYGGTPWAEACRILHSRELGTLGPNDAMNKKMFVDRAWTLEHNGGCFLNKIGWAQTNRAGWHMDHLKFKVLDAHAANPTKYKVLLKVASEDVITLWDQVWDVQNELRGEFRDNPRLVTGPVKFMCVGCKSNPLLGHTAKCRIRQAYDWEPGVDANNPKPWFYIVTEDDEQEGHPRHYWNWWTESDTSKLWYDPEFNLLDPNKSIVLRCSTTLNVIVESKKSGDLDRWGNPNTVSDCIHGSGFSTTKKIKAKDLDKLEIDIEEHLAKIKTKAYNKAVALFNGAYAYGKTEKYKQEDLRITFTYGSFDWATEIATGHHPINEPFNPKIKYNKIKLGAHV